MNRICSLLNIQYPIIQGGMIWCSGWKLASAVSNAGGLGLIGSGSMNPDLLHEHITQCKKATSHPFGVNIPLLFSHAEAFIHICIEEKVPVVFTSAGNPAKYTALLKQNGIKVVHVVANVRGALKCQETGVDAIVAEGFEAGGHNGKEETTTLVLIPMVKKAVTIPVIAAGGIATGRGMLAAFALGAEGVQIGSRFAASEESSAHIAFKQMIVNAKDGDTQLCLKKLVGVRLLKNKFYNEVEKLELAGASVEELSALLGRGRAQKGMFEGDTEEGELEIGQVSGIISEILPAGKIVKNIISEYNEALEEIIQQKFKL
ncbi:MAG: Nitronate monooxygenase [Bacteroidetes bacterium ADurb.Bin408]|nr:MAG: Nitronate monooxygenase [Bacteroidetes bacterium ADurb.Bin408]